MNFYIPPTIPGLSPPPGQTSNLVNPPRYLQQLAWDFVIFNIVAATLTTAARAYTRFFVSRNSGWDDYLMVATWAASVAMYGIDLKAIVYGAGIHQWNVPLVDVLEFAYWTYFSVILYPIVMAFLKLSICFQVLRIFVTRRDRHFWVISVFTFLQFGWFFAMFWAVLFQCKPMEKAFKPLRAGKCPVNLNVLVVCGGVFNVVSDIFIWVYPVLRVAQLNLSTRRKLGVAAIFLIGSVAIVAAVIRLYFSIRWLQNPLDATFTLSQLALTVVGEVIAGMIAANCVCLPRLFTHVNGKLSSFSSSSRITVSKERKSLASGERSDSNQEIHVRPKTEMARTETA